MKFPILPVNCVKIITAGGGEKCKVSKQIFLRFNIEQYEFDIPCLIIRNLACDVLLGIDFLCKYKCKIDCEANMLEFSDNNISVEFSNDKSISQNLKICAIEYEQDDYEFSDDEVNYDKLK